MNVIVTGFSQGKKIHAIKAVRAATGLGLREAKDAVEAVEQGRPVTLAVGGAEDCLCLNEGGVRFEHALGTISIADFVEILRRYSPALTVGDLADALTATAGVPSFGVAV